ncbi:MAG: Gfo/Idh/MocA family oxidoreductase [Planctomycetes bacterium]|nr:Gfo/Idh/MocA family oxidoreductase [Planctomycetota bacterium]
MIKKIAIIGFGNRGQCLAKECVECTMGRIQVISAADPYIENARTKLKELGCERTRFYTNPDEMFEKEDKNLDGYIIASTNDKHLENFLSISHTKKPLLLEKPLEGNRRSFFKLTEAVSSYRAPILIGHCMRHSPILKKTAELIGKGWIGNVKSIRGVQNCYYGSYFYRRWMRKKDRVTSLFIEKATHDFDVMHMLNNNHFIAKIFAYAERSVFGGSAPDDLRCRNCDKVIECPESIHNLYTINYGIQDGWTTKAAEDMCVFGKEGDIEDNEICMFKFSNGVLGSYIQTFFTPRSYTGRVYTCVGDEGIIEVDMGDYCGHLRYFPRFGTKSDKMDYEFDYLQRDHYNGDTFLVRNFYQIMNGKEKPLTTFHDAAIAELAGFAAVDSSKSSKEVSLHDIIPQDMAKYFSV